MLKKKKQQLLAKYKAELIKTRTPSEIRVEKLLNEAGYRFLAQKGFHTNFSFLIADFYLPKPYKIIIEVDGSSHYLKHYKDRKRDEEMLFVRGIKTLRIKNEETKTLTAFDLKVLIEHEHLCHR